MTLRHAKEQLTDAAHVVASGCQCEIDDADLSGFIDEASDIIAIITEGRVAGRTSRTYRPTLNGGCDLWPLTADLPADPPPSYAIPIPDDAESITAIIDGTALVDAEMRIHRHEEATFLIRIDPTTYLRVAWPATQNIYAPNTETNTFELSLTTGFGIEESAVKDAASELVCHLIGDWDPAKGRRRMRDVETASVGGASVSLKKKAEDVKAGRFNLRLVDRMMSLFAPAKSAEVWSPELATPWVMNRVSTL